jgi:hypothetical protein
MPDASMIAAKTMSSRWRAVCLLIIATLQVLLVWTAIRFVPRWDSWRWLVFGLSTAVLTATGYDIAKKGNLTRIAFFSWLCLFTTKFVHDIYGFWNHDPNVDLFFTLFADVFYIFIISVWTWRNPFGPKKVDPVTIKGNFT